MMQSADSNGQKGVGLLADKLDLTSTSLWKDTKAWFTRLYDPSFGKVSNAEHITASPDGSKIAFTATIWNSLENGSPEKTICIVDVLEKGQRSPIRHATQSTNTNKIPKWSPDGKSLAFLTDRMRKGHFQLYLMDTTGLGEARLATPQALDGVVPNFEWCADSAALLVYVVPFGLPIAGAEGSGYLADSRKHSLPNWMPTVSSGKPPSDLCSLWLCDLNSDVCRRVSRVDRNVWSFCWAGPHHAILKVSESSIGYSHQAATLIKLDLTTGKEELIRERDDQMVGNVVSTDSGNQVVVVESAGSERVKIVGKLALIDTVSKERTILTTNAVDVGYLAWSSPGRLFAMGLRNMHSVALEINTSTSTVRELWSTTDTCGGVNGFASGCVVPGKGFAVVRSNWKLAPEIVFVDTQSEYHQITSLDHDGEEWLRSQNGDRQIINWYAPDGTEIHGLLYVPMKGTAPYRTILFVHGGPFSAVTDKWLGYNPQVSWLVAHGYAVLCPNARGSVGKGADFTNAVKGDIGGGDAQDLLSGLDHIIKLGLADSNRLGVIGGSYGGYMTSWLVTQTNRFSAAVAGSPVCDYKLQWICGDERMPLLGKEIYEKYSLTESIGQCTIL